MSDALLRCIESDHQRLNALTAAEFEMEPRVAVYMAKKPLVALRASDLRETGKKRLPIREFDLAVEDDLDEFLGVVGDSISTMLGGSIVIGWLRRHGRWPSVAPSVPHRP